MAEARHILLLNPPGRHIYLREYFCGKISKASYLIHPVDLLWLSGQLRRHFDVTILDAIALRLSPEKTLDRIRALRPDTVIQLFATVSQEEDAAFAKAMHPLVPGELIGIGDNFFVDAPGELDRAGYLDAILYGFLQPTLASYLHGHRNRRLRNIVYRDGGKVREAPQDTSRDEFTVGLPCHDQLDLRRYRFPFARRLPYGTILTDYGCPFHCTFCLIGALGYRVRAMDDVFDELESLHQLGVRDLYIDDQTFMPNRNRLERFCDRLQAARLGMGWTAYVRADLSGDDRLRRMKAAGCHTVIVGIESGNDEILARYGKAETTAQIADAVQRARAMGLRAAGTFIIGLPGETRETCEQTIRFSLELGLDFASFNTPVPRAWTTMRNEVIEHGWQASGVPNDQSGNSAAIDTPDLPAYQLFRLRNRAERRFYLRPAYALRRLAGIRSLTELRLLLREGTSLAVRILARAFRGAAPYS